MGNTYKHNILPITIFIKLVVYVHWTSEKCIHVYYILSLFGAHTLSIYVYTIMCQVSWLKGT